MSLPGSSLPMRPLRQSRDAVAANHAAAVPTANRMPRRSSVARRWHQVRLGAAFVQFGITALATAFLVAPVLKRLSPGAEEAELRVQHAIQRAYAFTIGFLRAVRILRVRAPGLAADLAAEGPCIVVANHPTLLDVVLIGSQLKQMDCIVNAGWTAHSPFLARAIDAAGYVRNDAGMAAVDECAARLERGRTLLVFPEGTRSPWGSFGRFQRGAAHIALASGKPVVAVTIHCHPRMLGSGRKWHDVADGLSDFEMRIAGRLDPAAYQTDGASLPIAARRMTEDMLALFVQEPHLADS